MLELALAVREVSGLIPCRCRDIKVFAIVGNLLTTSVSKGLSKDSGSILLSTQYKAKNYITTAPYRHYTLELVLLSLFTNRWCSYPPE